MNKTILSWLGGIAAATLSGILVWWFTTDRPVPPQPAEEIGLFEGQWTNENTATDGTTRIEIHQRLNDLSVHSWGKCQPKDCDQGQASAKVSDIDRGILTLTLTNSFSVRTMKLSVMSDGRLRLVDHTHFTDSSKRPDYDSSDYFKRP